MARTTVGTVEDVEDNGTEEGINGIIGVNERPLLGTDEGSKEVETGRSICEELYFKSDAHWQAD